MKALFTALSAAFFTLVVANTAQAKDFPYELQLVLSKGHATYSDNTVWIDNNPGGEIQLFQKAAEQVLAEGWHLRIDGMCASACVILADMARENTCITAKAQIAVHQTFVLEIIDYQTARDGSQVPVGRLIRREDPPNSVDINAWVKNHGGYPTRGVMVMPIKDAQKFWPMCKK